MSLVRVSTLLLREGFQQRLADTTEKFLVQGYVLMHAIYIPTSDEKENGLGGVEVVPGSGALVLVFLRTDDGDVSDDSIDSASDADSILDDPDVMDTPSVPSDIETAGASAPPTEDP